MAHRITAASLWTVVVSVLLALLASLGIGRKAAPAAVRAAAPSQPAAGAHAVVCRPTGVVARRSRRAVLWGRALPPTIKQRIRAEAHGKSPSVRRSAAATGEAAEWPLSPVSPASNPSEPRPCSPSAAASASARAAGSGSARTAAVSRQGLALAA